MTARDAMLDRLRGRNLETALEREFYCSQDDYQVDLEMIWYRDWLFVGHDCEVLNPGNYLTVQVGEYPIIVLRDRDGGLRAFTTRAGIADREFARPSTVPRRAWYVPIINGPTHWMGA